MNSSVPGSSVHGVFQARILEWVAISLLWEIFPTQGLNLSLLHCRWILYQLNHQGRPGEDLSFLNLKILGLLPQHSPSALTDVGSYFSVSICPQSHSQSSKLSLITYLSLLDKIMANISLFSNFSSGIVRTLFTYVVVVVF